MPDREVLFTQVAVGLIVPIGEREQLVEALRDDDPATHRFSPHSGLFERSFLTLSFGSGLLSFGEGFRFNWVAASVKEVFDGANLGPFNCLTTRTLDHAILSPRADVPHVGQGLALKPNPEHNSFH